MVRRVDELNVSGKRVLVRADFNVPLNEEKKITDDNRIKQALQTVKFLIENNAKVILCSHLGEPSGKEDKFSLAPVAARLKELLKKDVPLAPDCVGPSVRDLVEGMKEGDVVLLENLRFNPGEKKNDDGFARELAALCDIYVSDAFATAHRKHASMVSVPRYVKEKCAGYLMRRELEFYERALVTPKKPLAVVLGGSKVSTKLNLLLNVAHKADILIIGGAMANTFLAAQGLQVGKSLYEPELFGKCIELLGQLARRDCKVYIPVDVVVAPSLHSKGLARTVTVQDIPADTMALDIGPATSTLYKEALANAETVVWNGPMGAFEFEDFSNGTTSMIETLANSHALTVVGGGDTDAAIHEMQLAHKFDFLSTGGGAFLALLEGNSLPGFEALK